MSEDFLLSIKVKKNSKASYKKVLQIDKKLYRRSTIKISENSSALTIDIAAKDIVALRASANSIMRDLAVISATLSTN